MPAVVSAHSRSSIKTSLLFELTPAEGAPVLIQDLAPKETMYSSQLHYIPLALPFFLFLAGLLLFLVVLIQIHVLQYAYSKLGLSSGHVSSSDRLFRHALRCAFGDRLA